jgi:hypothetical protein
MSKAVSDRSTPDSVSQVRGDRRVGYHTYRPAGSQAWRMILIRSVQAPELAATSLEIQDGAQDTWFDTCPGRGATFFAMKFKVATAQPKSDSNILQTVGWSSQAMPMAVERPRCSDYPGAITFKSALDQRQTCAPTSTEVRFVPHSGRLAPGR